MKNKSNNKRSKDDLFQRTNGGLDIFRLYLSEQQLNTQKLFHSVFRQENTPSAHLFKSPEGIYFYKDFAEGKALNCIDFAMKIVSGADTFVKALNACYDMIGGDIETKPLPPPAPAVEMVQIYPSEKQIQSAQNSTQKSNFHKYCNGLGIFDEHLAEWNVCSKVHRDNIYTTFLFVDHNNDILNIKSILYKEDGHRNKDTFPISLKHKAENDADGRYYGFCIFGEHLWQQEENKHKDIVLVESEKTAVIASFFYPQFNWGATRGAQGAIIEEYNYLVSLGKKVFVLVDADPSRIEPFKKLPHPKVPSSFLKLEKLGAKCHLLDLYPERMDKSDLADFIEEALIPEIGLPSDFTDYRIDTETGEVLHIAYMPPWARLPEEEDKPAKSMKKGGELGEELKEMAKQARIEQHNAKFDCIPAEAYEEEGNDPKHDLEEYRFFEFKNQYWQVKSNKDGDVYAEPFSNFTMKVLYHIGHGKDATRLVELKNSRGKTITKAIATSSLTTFTEFKIATESFGNYVFEGNAELHLRIKKKLLAMEYSCQKIDILGWQREGFFCFCNGIVKDGKFYEAESNGVIKVDKKYYYVDAANKSNDNFNLNVDERKVIFEERDITFSQWAQLHHSVFQKPGMMGQMFAVACLFSDVIFSEVSFFPLLFLYGEAGSGKGALIRSLQYLFGKPIDPLVLSSEANTHKGKLRTFARFRNMIICLEEYRNGNEKTVDMLKNIWDRMSYSRATKDSGYGTEVMPMNSGAIITGNDYPMNDALLTRLIVSEVHKNTYTQEETKLFEELEKFQRGNITSVTKELLQLRKAFEENFKAKYSKHLRDFSGMVKGAQELNDINGRMFQNFAVLLATFDIVNEEIALPYSWNTFLFYCKESLKEHASKREENSEIDVFWNVFLKGLVNRTITEKLHYKIDGNELFIRFSEVHNEYLQLHRQLYGIAGHGKQTILDKLKRSKAFVGVHRCIRFGTERSSGFIFDLNKISVDISGFVKNYKSLTDGSDDILQEAINEKKGLTPAQIPY